MSTTRIIVLLSLLLSAGVIVGAVFSTSGMLGSFSPGHRSELFGNAAAALLLVAVCAWPWFVALRAATNPAARVGANIFAFAAVVAAAVFYSPIRTAPSEGVGYYVIFYVLAVWIVGPFLLKIRSAERDA